MSLNSNSPKAKPQANPPATYAVQVPAGQERFLGLKVCLIEDEEKQAGRWTVVCVEPDSSAERAGIVVGDEMVKMGDIDSAGVTEENIKSLLAPALPLQFVACPRNKVVTLSDTEKVGVYVASDTSDLWMGDHKLWACVSRVDYPSPASKAGVTVGDYIVRVNGLPPSRDMDEFTNVIKSRPTIIEFHNPEKRYEKSEESHLQTKLQAINLQIDTLTETLDSSNEPQSVRGFDGQTSSTTAMPALTDNRTSKQPPQTEHTQPKSPQIESPQIEPPETESSQSLQVEVSGKYPEMSDGPLVVENPAEKLEAIPTETGVTIALSYCEAERVRVEKQLKTLHHRRQSSITATLYDL